MCVRRDQDVVVEDGEVVEVIRVLAVTTLEQAFGVVVVAARVL